MSDKDTQSNEDRKEVFKIGPSGKSERKLIRIKTALSDLAPGNETAPDDDEIIKVLRPDDIVDENHKPKLPNPGKTWVITPQDMKNATDEFEKYTKAREKVQKDTKKNGK